MKKISAVVLTKNAETMLVECLDSVAFCDEIVVVDTMSTDKTVKIAKEKGATVVSGIENNFAENRTIGLKKASGEWILYIDSDERVSPALRDSIMYHVARSTYSAFKILRQNFYLGNNPWPKIEHLERFFRKDHLKGWHGKLHETAQFEGAVGQLKGYLLHYTHRDLKSMVDKTIAWSKIEAQLRFDTKHPRIVAWRLVRVMITGFWDSYIAQGGWKAKTMGLIESMYQAYSMFITYASLWEMQNQKTEDRNQKTEK